MKAYKYILASALVAMSMGSCSDDNASLSGEGTVFLNPELKSDVKIVSRAEGDETLAQTLSDSFILWISNSNGVIRQYQGLDQVPDELTLLSGSYIAEAWAGDSVSASWNSRWFKGSAEFTVNNGELVNVSLPCKIANVAVSVVYDETVDAVLQDYTLSVSHSRGKLEFDEEHQASIGYFMMPSTDSDLSWTLTGTKKEDGTTLYTRTSTISNVQPAHHYIFKISCSAADPSGIGGAFLDIEIDDTEIYQEDTELIPLAPIIKGSGFNINEVQYCDQNKVGKRSIYVFGTSYLKSVVVECAQLSNVLSDQGTDFDALGCSDAVKQELHNGGILFRNEKDEANGTEQMKLTFDEDFCNTYFCEDGKTYTIKVSATDEDNQTAVRTLSIRISADPIAINDVNTALIGFSHKAAVIEGQILKAEKLAENSPIVISYAESGSSAWSEANATVDGENFSANLTGLKPGTTYQYYAAVDTEDGEHFTTESKTFTTEPATQLPNSGFESWQTSSSPYLIYGSGEEMWWDSGNHGSATMSKNVTTPNSDIKHSGNYSIDLKSQFVGVGIIGKFAAGNVFIGKYLATDGTDGILGWGRPFTGRPSAVTGYVKYSPVAIDYANGPDGVSKGDMDNGIIYCALMDDNLETYNGEKFPVIIKTKSSERQLFDKDGSHVIAYGEIKFTEATSAEGLVEFTINLDYKRTDIRPSYIVLTASSSVYGDYFSGGSGSEMWLDDIELIYE